MIVWICGPAGSGKTTIAKAFAKHLSFSEIVWLDGDEFRDIIDDGLGFSLSDSKRNALRLAQMALLLRRQNWGVIVSAVTLPEFVITALRSQSKLIVVELETRLSVRARRRPGLIEKAVYLPPVNTDLRIDNDADLIDFQPIVDQILKLWDERSHG